VTSNALTEVKVVGRHPRIRLRITAIHPDADLTTNARSTKWGGYSQDFDAAEHVHTHEEVQAHPEDNWAVVDIEDYSSEEPRSLLIIDIDLYKADDPDEGDGVEDVEAVRKTGKPNGTPFAKSQSGEGPRVCVGR